MRKIKSNKTVSDSVLKVETVGLVGCTLKTVGIGVAVGVGA